MLDITVRPCKTDDSFEVGDTIFVVLARMPDEVLVVEQAEVTELHPAAATTGTRQEPIVTPYTRGSWKSATGTTASFSYGAEGHEPSRLFVADPDGLPARCYEQIGTAVTVTLLVGEMDPESAQQKVLDALAAVAEEVGTVTSSGAYDKTSHIFETDGKPIAENVPHWDHWSRHVFGTCITVEGCLSPSLAMYQIIQERVKDEERAKAARPRRGRPPKVPS